MLLEKILVVGAIAIFGWWAYPHLAAGEWLSPTPLPPNWWGLAQAPGYEYLAQPSEGYGFSRFDMWNNPPSTIRSATKADFTLQPLK